MRTAPALLAATLIVAAPAFAEYKEIEVTNGATIAGQVRVVGEIPKLPPQPVYKQKETCGTELPDPRLVVGKNGALQNAIVYLTDIKSGKAVHLDEPVKLDNLKCAFVPHVTTASVGQTLDIHNSDPFLHDAHARLGAQTLFNVAIMKDHTVHQPLMEPGLIHLNCNIRHTWMHGYILVSEHPYHTVTDAEGRFRLEGIPPGIWTVRVWHELLGSVDRQVRVGAGETSTQEITLQGAAAAAGEAEQAEEKQ